MDEELKSSILRSLELSGSANSEIGLVRPIIATPNQAKQILNLTSGPPRISHHYVKRFKLLLSQPLALAPLNPFEIRCCLCKSVVSYPAWHFDVKFAVNWFHYFICFDGNSKDKPTTRCYRRF